MCQTWCAHHTYVISNSENEPVKKHHDLHFIEIHMFQLEGLGSDLTFTTYWPRKDVQAPSPSLSTHNCTWGITTGLPALLEY